MDELIYLTTSNTSTIVKPLFYNNPCSGDIIFEDGKTLKDLLGIQCSQDTSDITVLKTDSNKVILTSDGLGIEINNKKGVV